jgi:hypothetical protein
MRSTDLDYDLVDDDIGAVAEIQAHILVDHRERRLAFERQVVVMQFPASTCLVDKLE